MDTAYLASQSDPLRNRHFSRRRIETFDPRPAPADRDDTAEPALATLLRWRAEWRERRAQQGRR